MATITHTKFDQQYYLPQSKQLIKDNVEVSIKQYQLDSHISKTVPRRFGTSWWLVADRYDDDDDDWDPMIEETNDISHCSSPPLKRIKLGKSLSQLR